jgi:hypothetical protein
VNAVPIVAIARAEVRRSWRTLLLVTLLAGLVGGTTVGALALARRTTTAYDRLGRVTGVDDARGSVPRGDDLVDRIVRLPEVTDSWTGRTGVAQVEGTFDFLGITAGPDRPSTLLRPLVLEGRLPGPAGGDVIEVVLRDDFQREVGVPVGTEVPVRFLTQDDYFAFDTGFEGGSPHGPRLTLRVVGTVRLAGGVSTLPPAFADAAALRDHPDAFEPGAQWFVALDGGQRSFDEFSAGVARLAEGRSLPPEAREFPVAAVSNTASAAAAVDHTAGLLGRALLALAAAGGLAGLIALLQTFTRHHAGGADEQAVESALGLTTAQRRTARLLAASVPTVGAIGLATVVAMAASRLDPIGAIAHYEPSPGPSVNVAIVVSGIAAVGVAVLLSTLVTSALAGRRRPQRAPRESTLVEHTTRLGSGPASVTGLRFALEPGRGSRAVPVRSAIIGAVIGVGGVVAGIVYTASLDRLATSPQRAGVAYDALVADVRAGDVSALLDDPDIGSLVTVESAGLTLDGHGVSGHAITDLRGSLPIDLDEGRLPRTPDEVALGLRAVQDLGKGVGDTVTATDDGGAAHELAIVGTAVVPPFNGEQLGVNALVTPEGLARAGASDAFVSAALLAAPETDPAALVDRLAEERETGAPSIPTEVDNLRQLGRLPASVAGLVGLIGVLGLANALVVLVRRRRSDLALLRTIGFTRRQGAVAILVMAVTIVTIGVLVGVPVGIAFGSSVWELTAAGAFVTTDPLVRWWTIAAVVAAAVAVSLVAALLPARRAGQTAPAALLRAE